MKKTITFTHLLCMTPFVLLLLNSYSQKGLNNFVFEKLANNQDNKISNIINSEQSFESFQSDRFSNEFSQSASALFAADTNPDTISACRYKRFETAIAHDTSTVYFPEECKSIKYTPDSCGFIVAANIVEYNPQYKEYMELLRLRENSDVIWNYRYYFDEYQSGNLNDVEVTSDMGYVSCGWIFDEANPNLQKNMVIMKTDYYGSPQWSTRSFQEHNEVLNDMIQTNDGNYIAVGYAEYNYRSVPFVVKLDPSGNQQWANMYIPPQDEYIGQLSSVREVMDSNNSFDGYISSGYTYTPNNTMKDVLIMRFNNDGSLRWSKVVPKDNNQEGRSIVQTNNNGIFAVTGYTDTASWYGYYRSDLLLMFFDENNLGANFQFNRITANQSSLEEGFAIELLDNNDLVICGLVTDSIWNTRDALLLSADYNANVNWSKRYGDTDHVDSARAVATYLDEWGDRFIAFAGATQQYFTSYDDYDYYIVNTDANGNTGCNRVLSLYTINEFEEFEDIDYNLENVETQSFEMLYIYPEYFQDTCNGELTDTMYGCEYEIFETAIAHDTGDTYSDEEGRSIKYIPDSCGFIVAADVINNDPVYRKYMELVRLNENSDVLWNYRYYFDDYQSGNLNDVEVTIDKGYVSCGWIWDDANPNLRNNMVVLKTDYSGTPQWSTHSLLEDDDELQDMVQTHDDNYVAVGYSRYNNTWVPMIVKLDPSGNKIWANMYCNIQYEDEYLYSVREVIDSNNQYDGYISCGYHYSRGTTGNDVLVMRIDEDGTLRWSAIVPRNYNQEGRNIVQTKTPGLFAVTGYTDTSSWNGYYSNDLLLMLFNEFNLGANIQFNRITATQSSYEVGYAIELIDNDALVISGIIADSSWYAKDALLLSTDYYGNVNWSKRYGDTVSIDSARAVATYLDNSGDRFIAFTGTTTRYLPSTYDYDIYVVNTDAMGNTGCNRIVSMQTINELENFEELQYDMVDVELKSLEMNYYAPYFIQDTCNGEIDKIDKRAAPEGTIIKEYDKVLKLYPNPLSEDKILNLDFSTPEYGNVKVTMFSSFGEVVKVKEFRSAKGVNKYQIQLDNLSTGLYYLRFNDGKTEFSSKIIVIR